MNAWTTRAMVLLALALLTGCGGGERPQSQAVRTIPYGECIARLELGGVTYEEIGSFEAERGCGIAEGVRIRRSLVALDRPFQSTCTLAALLLDFERDTMQPAALQHLGQPVARINHAGTYACRGRSGNRGRLSEHAFGRAIDIWSFELADGTKVSVRDDWRSGDGRSAFLRAIARGACKHFSVILTPARDADHQDHFHFDVGPWSLCGA